jgi:hypothetical protein
VEVDRKFRVGLGKREKRPIALFFSTEKARLGRNRVSMDLGYIHTQN